MRSLSALEWAEAATGATAQGVWCGAVAAVLTGAPWASLAAFAAATVLGAAALARGATEDDRLVRTRAALVGLLVAATAVLFLVGRSWTHDYVVWQVVRDVAFVAVLCVLGVLIGQGEQGPHVAVRRAVRAFALTCGALVLAVLVGATLPGAALAVAAVLLAGGSHVAVARYVSLTRLVAPADRLPAAPWFAAVATAILGIVVVAALVGLLLDGEAARTLLAAIASVFSHVLDALGFVIGWAGAGLIRALSWLAGLTHLRVQETQAPPMSPAYHPPSPSPAPAAPVPGGARVVGTVVVATAAITAAAAVVVLALRRLRRNARGVGPVDEERESLRTVPSVATAVLGALGRRFRRLAGGGRRHAADPAELIRRRYAGLERRLTRDGAPRAPGETVRGYLASCVSPGGPSPDRAAAAAADLAGLYEFARYSAHAVDLSQARRFEALAGAFPGPDLAAGGR